MPHIWREREIDHQACIPKLYKRQNVKSADWWGRSHRTAPLSLVPYSAARRSEDLTQSALLLILTSLACTRCYITFQARSATIPYNCEQKDLTQSALTLISKGLAPKILMANQYPTPPPFLRIQIVIPTATLVHNNNQFLRRGKPPRPTLFAMSVTREGGRQDKDQLHRYAM